jgi:hypothetical protein
MIAAFSKRMPVYSRSPAASAQPAPPPQPAQPEHPQIVQKDDERDLCKV